MKKYIGSNIFANAQNDETENMAENMTQTVLNVTNSTMTKFTNDSTNISIEMLLNDTTLQGIRKFFAYKHTF